MTGNPNGRTAGILYLLVAVTGGFSMLYVPSLIVPGDAAATATNILARESLFRLGIVSGLVCQVLFVLLVLALYRLFKRVDDTYASTMVAFVIAAVPVAFLNMLNQLAALHVVSGVDYLKVFDSAQQRALGMLMLDVHAYGLLIVEVFWGLWLLPLGLLVIKSRAMPRWLGILLIVAFAGYVIDFLTRLLIPAFTAPVAPVAAASKFGELAMILWLLIKGVKEREATTSLQRG